MVRLKLNEVKLMGKHTITFKKILLPKVVLTISQAKRFSPVAHVFCFSFSENGKGLSYVGRGHKKGLLLSKQESID